MVNTFILILILLVLVYQNFWSKIIKIRIKNPIKQWKYKAYRKRKLKAWDELDQYRDWIKSYYNIKEDQPLEEYQKNMINHKADELEQKYKIKF